jgi:integrase
MRAGRLTPDLNISVAKVWRLCRMRHSRHTFVIQHIHAGTDIKWISKWLGHESVAVTLEHYGNWIGETKKMAEEASEEAHRRMVAKVAALRDQTNIDRTNSSATPLGTR